MSKRCDFWPERFRDKYTSITQGHLCRANYNNYKWQRFKTKRWGGVEITCTTCVTDGRKVWLSNMVTYRWQSPRQKWPFSALISQSRGWNSKIPLRDHIIWPWGTNCYHNNHIANTCFGIQVAQVISPPLHLIDFRRLYAIQLITRIDWYSGKM